MSARQLIRRPVRGAHARGQAIFETALFMPLFLLGFFGVIFAVSYSSLAERVQLGVRYGGTISNVNNAYNSYSLYSLYDKLDGGTPVDVTHCGGALPNQAGLTQSRAAIWKPVNVTTGQATCAGGLGELTFSGDSPALLEGSTMQLTAQTPFFENFMQANVFGGSSAPKYTSAQATFYRSPDVGSLLGCTILGTAVKNSLEAVADTSTSNTTVATPFPAVLPTANVAGAPSSCMSYGTAPPLVYNTQPPVVPPPTPTPTPVPPTPTPSPCPAGYSGTPGACKPPATPTPVRTPTPVPTACPAGYSGTPGACKPPTTPTPAPTPTKPATTPPTSSPATASPPTAVPTAAPTPTPPPTPTPAPTEGVGF